MALDVQPHSVSLWIPGVMPGINEIIGEARKNRFAGAKQKKLWTEKIHWLAKAAKLPHFESAHFVFNWVEKSKLRNPDNIAGGMKFVFDGLQSAGVISNDGWGQVLSHTHRYSVDKTKPGVLVEIHGEPARPYL